MWIAKEMGNGSMSLSSVTQIERGPQVQETESKMVDERSLVGIPPTMTRSFRVQVASSFKHSEPVFLLANSH